MFQICRDVEAVGFPVQNAYNMAYGDENTTFEPVKSYQINRHQSQILKKPLALMPKPSFLP